MKHTLHWHRIAPTRRKREVELLATTPYFTLEGTTYQPLTPFTATGTIHYNQELTGKRHELRIRLEYPSNFPKAAPRVYDHDRVLKPDPDGHLLSTHELCLTLPERAEFSLNADSLTTEVLGAALIWYDKRRLYDKYGTWPGPAERHGINANIDLLIEQGIITDEQTITTWLLNHASTPTGHLTTTDPYAPCPCGSGKRLKFCHYTDLAPLLKRLNRAATNQPLTTAMGNK